MSAPSPINFNFDNSYARELEGLYVDWKAARVPHPTLVALNKKLAAELGLDARALASEELIALCAGNEAPHGAHPLAQAYAGHQFGGFSPQLGDGRALVIGEVIDLSGQRRDIQLKGSGRTPFSRGGDGKAALGPVLREYLIAEAMHALGIPTTRALAAVSTGETIRRERDLPGAVLTRVASSHIRVGTFQFFAARNDLEKLRRLADYTIWRHFPNAQGSSTPYVSLVEAVVERQAKLIAQWMLIGFVHGVMNTDNMTIFGETIDYGPCAFLDVFDPAAVFSSIDEGGRYAFANQPVIGQWNLARFAETLIPLVHPDPDESVRLLTDALAKFKASYAQHWLNGMRSKLGLFTTHAGDLELANRFLEILSDQRLDYSHSFRALSNGVVGESDALMAGLSDATAFSDWLREWSVRTAREPQSPNERAHAMNQVNPVYIPRNHKVEEVLSAAVENNDFTLFNLMNEVLAHPFHERPDRTEFTLPPPSNSKPHKTFCGT